MKRIEDDVIPAGTPVIVRCNSANPVDNKIEPVAGDYTFRGANYLGGVYCSISVTKHRNTTSFDPITMRLLSLNEKGELAFVASPPEDRLYKGLFLMANKAYLRVNPGEADVMTLDGYTASAISKTKQADNTSTAIYTLAGTRVPDGAALSPGIYIRNGKKIIVK